jgi:hypothetical protein
MRQRLDDAQIFGEVIFKGWRLKKLVWVPADNAVFDKSFPPYIELNPAGAVDILLPNVTEADAGLMFLLSNPSASTVTLKTAADAAFTTAIVLATLENTLLFCTGSTTAALGWRAVGTALSS